MATVRHFGIQTEEARERSDGQEETVSSLMVNFFCVLALIALGVWIFATTKLRIDGPVVVCGAILVILFLVALKNLFGVYRNKGFLSTKD